MSPEILLLPGTLCDNDLLWSDVRGALEPLGRVRPVALTAPSIDGMVKEVLEGVADELILVGFSLGGIVAMAAHRQHRDRVHGMALICTTARPPRPEQHETWRRLDALACTDFDAVIDQTVESMLSGGADANRHEATVREMAARVGCTTFCAQLTAQRGRVDERPGLAASDAPVLVVSAEQDRVCPPPLGQEIAELCNNSELHTVAACGHLAPLDQPGEVARLLQEWLRKVVAGQVKHPGPIGEQSARPSHLEPLE